MSDSTEKSRELLRQAELRIKGILEFSSELDNKIFKLLALTTAISSVLVFFLINQHSTFTNKNLLFSLTFALGIISFAAFSLLMAVIGILGELYRVTEWVMFVGFLLIYGIYIFFYRIALRKI